MANHKGSEGVVKKDTNTIAEVRSWELSTQAELIEDTILSDSARTYKAGNTGWSGSLSCWWDETDTNGQQALDAGSEVTLNLYPEGDTTGDTYFTGSAIITSVRRSGAINGVVEAEFQFTGNGALSEATV